jgi:general secretion pathway protein D
MKYLLLILLLSISILANDEKINVNFKDLKLEELVNIVSNKTGKNILVATKLDGKVDFISNKPMSRDGLFNLLEKSLSKNGYILKKEKNFYSVEKIKIKKIEPIKKLEFINTIVYLKYLEVDEIKVILDMISKDRKLKVTISVNKESNFVIIDGNKKSVDYLTDIVNKLDISKSQIYIKAKIVEVNDNLVDEIGIKYGILGSKVYSGGINSISSSLNSGDALPFDIGSIGLSIPNLSSSLALGATINLLNKTYALNIVSEPSLLCINNKESLIYVGETLSVQTASTTTDGGTTKNSFERQDIGLTLKVKPRVIENNKVLINIDTTLEGVKNIDSLSFNPNTTKKLIKTNAIVNNGESVILGGLIEYKNEKGIEKIPVASDIPLIGELFKNRFNDSSKKNLTVILTPYIVPKNKDLSFIRNELTKLQVLEDRLLSLVLEKLKKKKEIFDKKDTKKNVREQFIKAY